MVLEIEMKPRTNTEGRESERQTFTSDLPKNYENRAASVETLEPAVWAGGMLEEFRVLVKFAMATAP